jgi:hypothetical protein
MEAEQYGCATFEVFAAVSMKNAFFWNDTA